MPKSKREAPVVIDEFEGEEVTGIRLVLRGTGDGLQKAVKVAPVKLHRHQVVQLVCQATTSRILHRDSDEDPLYVDRVQILDCEAITIVDDPQVRKLITAHIKALADARELAGQQSLDDANKDGEDD